MSDTTTTPREWIIDTITAAPEAGMIGSTCGYSESGCPCCTCEEEAETLVTWTRARWSRSAKAWKMEATREGRCATHAACEDEGPSC